MVGQINTKERREDVLDYLQNFGPFGVPRATIKEIAVKWECSERTIYKDINFVITHVKIPKMQKMGQRFLLGYEKAMKVVAQMMQDDDADVRAKGIIAFNQTQDHYTKMCEKYGFKETLAHKIEIEGDLNYNMLTKEEREAEIKRLLKK